MLQPQIWQIRDIVFPGFEKIRLSNGIEVYVVRGGTEPVFKLELSFPAGRWYERKAGAAQAVAALLGESTTYRNSEDMSEAIEFFGAQVSHDAGADMASVQLLALNQFAEDLLPLFYEMTFHPAFTEEDLEDYRKQALEELLLQETSNSYLAEQALQAMCFGAEHPYGPEPGRPAVRDLSPADLKEHHENCYSAAQCRIFLSGHVDDKLIKIVEKVFGGTGKETSENKTPAWPSINYHPGLEEITGPQDTQAAIFMGKPVISRKHSDFRTLFVTNTILGGFFGSRLMRNIREEKGMTYHIGSSLENYLHGGILAIFTELNVGSVDACLQQIALEMRQMREEKVGEKELAMVLNYMTGNILSQCDGPFASAEYLKVFLLELSEAESIEEDIALYRQVTGDDILRCAQVYLNEGDFSRVIARKSPVTH